MPHIIINWTAVNEKFEFDLDNTTSIESIKDLLYAIISSRVRDDYLSLQYNSIILENGKILSDYNK